MADQRDKAATEPVAPVAAGPAPGAATGISRRTLLRGASAAAPAILTLNSNAAFGWAITSGTIGTRQPTGVDQSATCLVDGTEVDPVNKPGVYYANGVDFVEVRSDLKYSLTGDGSQLLAPDMVCVQTGPVYYSADNGATWSQTSVQAPGGAVVSFAALSAASFNPGNVPLWPNV